MKQTGAEMRALIAALALIANPAFAAWHGGQANPNTTEMDVVASSAYAVCAAKRVLSGYLGPLYQVTRDSDGATKDIYPTWNNWPDPALLAAFAGSSLLLRTVCYDQSGNGNVLANAPNNAPYINSDGAHPIFDNDGISTRDLGGAGLQAFTNGVSGASIVIVRQAETTNNTLQTIANITGGTTGSLRMILRLATNNKSVVGGRVLDTDTTTHFSPGLTSDTGWHTEVASWNFASATMVHTLDSSSETVSNYETGSNTSATNSTAVSIAGGATGGPFFQGKVSVIAFLSGVITPQSTATLVGSLTSTEITSAPANQFPVWPVSVAPQGPFTLAPNVTTSLVTQPDGTTPAYSDVASMRYHHHTRVGIEPSSGRIFVCHSANPVNETDGGMFAVCESSSDGGNTWNAPTVAVPPQSTFYPGGGTGTNALYAYPRNMQTYNGQLYLVVDVDGGSTGAGLGLVAVQCNPDGTLGTPAVISPGGMWTPYDVTFPVYSYDPGLGPALYPYNVLHGQWQGTPAQFTSVPLSSWTGESRANGSRFAEPATVTLANGWIIMLWRKTAGALTSSVWIQISKDGGNTFGPMVKTNLPNEPSAVDAILLSNGHLAVLENPADQAGLNRDPLYIATFDGSTGASLAVYAVAQNINDFPTWPGISKSGGPTYSGAVESSQPNGVDTLYVSFSWHGKENISLAAIPVAGL